MNLHKDFWIIVLVSRYVKILEAMLAITPESDELKDLLLRVNSVLHFDLRSERMYHIGYVQVILSGKNILDISHEETLLTELKMKNQTYVARCKKALIDIPDIVDYYTREHLKSCTSKMSSTKAKYVLG